MGQYIIQVGRSRFFSAESTDAFNELLSVGSPLLAGARAQLREDGFDFSPRPELLADMNDWFADNVSVVRIDVDPSGSHGFSSHLDWGDHRVPGGKVFTRMIGDSTVGIGDAA